MSVPELDISFDAMGSRVRLLIGEPAPGVEPAALAVERARRFVAEFEAALSRFKPGSELSAFNADRRFRVPASELLRAAVRVGLDAARRSGGLVDPTLVDEIESAGYATSRAGRVAAPLPQALAAAPPRRPAGPGPGSWRLFEVDDAAGAIYRPPGVRFDTGGSGKGLAADLIAAGFSGYSRYLVDCGGDIRAGGPDAAERPYEVFVDHPLHRGRSNLLRLGAGAVATSGLSVRIWRRPDGGFGHHLLDPSTGEPAWTGLIAATALGPTAAEAETLAKTALLSGPEGARPVLAGHGGLLIHDGGRVEPVGPLASRPRISLPSPEPRQVAA